ncbi:putative lipopolysaccharide heptosyltransferase III [Neisseria zalophi]|uniref:Putative lipopolysaccharide heptosyltransferase III n=1 Tax=Neisseria zalophi TaxID=640030 RepID=A0A5J6PRY4_9NEIS|nr:putative lipopolysaccharide heptosyltransferase III [Neisseria zalophi]QEY25528.1 putative lipopolysaccharide heptosyltransferase III [Neisseria zalophi]
MSIVKKNKQFLIIKLQHHGDVLLTTPLIDKIKHTYPDSHIDMLVYKETADILHDNHRIRQIFTIDRQWKKAGIYTQLKHEYELFSKLKVHRYDWIFNLSDQWRAAAIAKLCGLQSVGFKYAKRNNALWRFCHNELYEELGPEHHIVENHLTVLCPLDLQDDYVPCVNMEIDPATRKELHHKLYERGWQGEEYILIHPGSRWIFKCWDNDKTTELLQRLLDAGYNIVVTAAPDAVEQAMLAEITGRLKIPQQVKLWQLSGVLNLRELAAAIDGAKLFIGVDSVPMHMAAALDKPQIALFGPSWVSRWRPYSDKATVIWAGDFGDLPHPDSINTADSKRWLSKIPVDAVWYAVKERLMLTN